MRRTSAAATPGRILRKRAAELPGAVPYAPTGAPLEAAAACCYAELDRRARAVAARLGRALPPGSRVMLAYRPGPDMAGAFYGCLYAGMVAVPYVQSDADAGAGARADGVVAAVERVGPAAVLTSADAWSALPVNRDRVPVIEADGAMVGGRPVWRLAERWRPVGVLRDADAYHRYVPGAMAARAGGLSGMGGRLEPALTHGDLFAVLQELQDAARLGVGEEELGWIASVHGMDDAVWRLLLPVHEGRSR